MLGYVSITKLSMVSYYIHSTWFSTLIDLPGVPLDPFRHEVHQDRLAQSRQSDLFRPLCRADPDSLCRLYSLACEVDRGDRERKRVPCRCIVSSTLPAEREKMVKSFLVF